MLELDFFNESQNSWNKKQKEDKKVWKEEEDAFKLQSTRIKSKIVFFARWQTEMQHVKCNVSDQSVSLSHSFRVKAINCITSVLKVFNRCHGFDSLFAGKPCTALHCFKQSTITTQAHYLRLKRDRFIFSPYPLSTPEADTTNNSCLGRTCFTSGHFEKRL